MSKLSLTILTVSVCLVTILGIERVIKKNKDQSKEIIQRFSFFLHPNAITIWGGVISIVGMILYSLDHPDWGIVVFIVGAFADMLDGVVARCAELITSVGKKLDPLVDKIKYFIPLIYFAYEGVLSWRLVLLFFVIDFLGQYLRNAVHLIQKIGLSFTTPANNFGKIKAVLALILTVYCLLRQPLGIPNLADYTLWAIVVLATLSLIFKFTRIKKVQEA